MDQGSLEVLRRHGEAVGWAEVLVGYDLGLVEEPEVRAWLAERGLALPGEGPFAERLWAARGCFGGPLPEPGGNHWARAQDRWRRALVLEALALEHKPAALARFMEALYARVACADALVGRLQGAARSA